MGWEVLNLGSALALGLRLGFMTLAVHGGVGAPGESFALQSLRPFPYLAQTVATFLQAPSQISFSCSVVLSFISHFNTAEK